MKSEIEENKAAGVLHDSDTASQAVRILLDVLSAQGIGGAVISPGSRNAPIIIGLSVRHEIEKWIVPDERTAAFMALGMAMVKQSPVLLVCTSGTALYNYAPAVAEAFYQHVPLIVVSADRPKEWIDQDDSQTLIQPGALDNIVKKSFDIPVIRKGDKNELWYANRIANEGYCLANSGKKGPVHINLQLDNPLDAMECVQNRPVRTIKVVSNRSPLPFAEMDSLGKYLADRKILLTAGFLPVMEDMQKAVSLLAKMPNVAIMAETLSNIHLDRSAYAIDSALTMLHRDEMDALKPDVVISVGGALISRMLKDFLRQNAPFEHWTLGDTHCGTDTFRTLTTNFEVYPPAFLKALASSIRFHQRKGCYAVPAYKEEWQRIKTDAIARHKEFVDQSEWSELKALDQTFNTLPRECNLFLSNGTVVRYAQICTSRLPHLSLGCRGVSGIDGTNAAALGASLAYKGKTILITGDLSFSYCTEILASPYVNSNFGIIVINNKGGGIFRFIKSTRDLPERKKYFEAAPNLPLRQLCSAYKIPFRSASSEKELESGLGTLLDEGGILEVMVPEEYSAELLRSYFIKK